jgi:hypothetical protein
MYENVKIKNIILRLLRRYEAQPLTANIKHRLQASANKAHSTTFGPKVEKLA